MMWKKWCKKNSSTFFHMKFNTLLFSKQKFDMMTWLMNIMNTLLQVKTEFLETEAKTEL